MKTLHSKIIIAVGVLAIAAFAVSCLPKEESMGSAGQTLIKLYSPTADGYNLLVVDPKSEPQSFLMFDIRRNCANAAELNSETVVTFQYDDVDTTMLKAYNTLRETDFVPMGPSLYTLDPALPADRKYTFTFAPGEQAKTVKLTIPNAFDLDMGLKYAFIFKVSVTGTGAWSKTSYDTLLTQILPKNQFDGIYNVTANTPMVDYANGALLGNYPFQYKLVTTGAFTCECWEVDNDYPLHPIMNNGAWSYYGSFGLVLHFNPDNSGTIDAVTNYFGQPAGNSRSAELNPAGVNAWDPATKNITIMYYMKQPTVVPTPPNIRTAFDETWTYIGPR